MSFKLFDVISIEERNGVVETTMDVLEVVAMEDMDHDVSIVANEINGQIAAMESSLEVADMLDAKIAVEEAIVEAGTATQGIAQMAMVSLQNTAALVGMNPSKFAISNESMEANPTTALKVSLESAKETFKAIIEKIKLFFSKVWSNIKKMSGKLLLMVTNFEKTFKSLEEKAAKLGAIKEGKDGELTESQQVKLATKAFASYVGGSLALKTSTIIDENYVEGVSKYFSDEDDIGDKEIKLTPMLDNSKFASEVEKNYDNVPKLNANDKVFISRVDGGTIKGEVITLTSVAVPPHKVIDFKPFSCKAKKDVVKVEAKNIKVLELTAIKEIISAGATEAGKAKDYVKKVDTALDYVDAALEKAKGKNGEADAKLDKVHASNLSKLSTSALRHSSAILLGYIAEMKNTMSVAQIHMSKYQAAK